MEITKKWAKDTLKAVEELIIQYKTDTHTGLTIDCPLCMSVGKDINGEINCNQCPWIVFKKDICYHNEDYDSGDIDIDTPEDTRWKKLQLNRLYGWKRKLNNIINK